MLGNVVLCRPEEEVVCGYLTCDAGIEASRRSWVLASYSDKLASGRVAQRAGPPEIGALSLHPSRCAGAVPGRLHAALRRPSLLSSWDLESPESSCFLLGFPTRIEFREHIACSLVPSWQ